ncbi:hypothetical protein CL658_05665 [bacterium]|mgnify:CR=1 FL=1|nr:hypothetical protein [bacterium]|tara:strand:- start:420 stop:1028 length:609 start_codon:yes stop_codon:yes gene_type:complete
MNGGFLFKRVVFVCLVLWFGFFLLLLVSFFNIRSFLVYESVDIPDSVDAIVVLAGGTGNRVQEAMVMIDRYLPTYLIMTGGPYFHTTMPRLMGVYANQLRDDLPRLLYEENSYSTYDHIRNLPPLLDRYDIKSILIVTSAYHTARSYTVFQAYNQTFGLDYDIFIHAAEDNIDYSGWWQDHDMIERVVFESLKRIYYHFFLF